MRDVTFVCCIESGPLEEQTVSMIESLRKWGGAWSNKPVVAVTPRIGPPLTRSTRKALKDLNVEHLNFVADNKYAWKAFLNKHFSMAAVEEKCNTEYLCWLDSDLLILKEPVEFDLVHDVDFLACPSDSAGATRGGNDEMEQYWRRVCENLNVDFDSLPWVTTQMENEKIRFYFNSGVFLYRRDTQLSKHHLENTIKFFDSKITSNVTGTFFTQHILGLTVHKLNLKWKELSVTHNYPIGSASIESWRNCSELSDVHIFHYHDSMWQPCYQEFVQTLKGVASEQAEWLGAKGPLKNNATIPSKIFKKLLELKRGKQEARFIRDSSIV